MHRARAYEAAAAGIGRLRMRNANTKDWVVSARFVTLLCVSLCVLAGYPIAETHGSASSTATASTSFSPREFVTHHEGTFGGEKIHYTAIAADTVLADEAGSPVATIFSFSYI